MNLFAPKITYLNQSLSTINCIFISSVYTKITLFASFLSETILQSLLKQNVEYCRIGTYFFNFWALPYIYISDDDVWIGTGLILASFRVSSKLHFQIPTTVWQTFWNIRQKVRVNMHNLFPVKETFRFYFNSGFYVSNHNYPK